MKRTTVLIVLLSFLFFGIGNTQQRQNIDTNTVNGWKVTNYEKVITFYTGFSATHYDGGTSQIFGFEMSDTSGYIRVEKVLTTPMPKPEAMDFTAYLVAASPQDGNIIASATIYLAHGDTVERVQNWGLNNNTASYWQTIGFATEVQEMTISEVDRIIFEFKFWNYGVPSVISYSAEYLIDHMQFWYHHTDGSYGPTVIDTFEGKVTAIDVSRETIPQTFQLSQNYPNPFNPTTSIRYTVSSITNVRLAIYDVLGREVATLVNEEKPAGEYTVRFDGSGLSSGVYFYRLETSNGLVQTKKMILLR